MGYSSTYTQSGETANRHNFLVWYRNETDTIQDLPRLYDGICGTNYSIPAFASARPFGFVLNLTTPETTATFANLIIAAVDKDLNIVTDNFLTLQQDTSPTTGYRIWGYTSSLALGTSTDLANTKYFVIYDNVSSAIIWRSSQIKVTTQDALYSDKYVRFQYRNLSDRFGMAYNSIIASEANFYNYVYLEMRFTQAEYISELSVYEEVSTGNERVNGTSLNKVLNMRGYKWDDLFHEAAQVALGTSAEIFINGKRYIFEAASGYDGNTNEISTLSLSSFRLFEYDYQLTDKS